MTSNKSGNECFAIDGKTKVLIADGEDGPTKLAGDYLAADVERITGTRPTIATGTPENGIPCLFIASATNEKALNALKSLGVKTDEIAGNWEAYLFHTSGETLVICGADPLATMRGVYGFSRIAMKVDPFHWWTGIEPAKQDKIVLDDIDQVIPSPTFRFRAWFLNSGRLIHWNLGPGPDTDFRAKYGKRAGQAGISGAFGKEMTEIIVEACLRADINTIIPLSYLDLEDPGEKQVADICDRFGVFLSHHHQEPCGANLRFWDDFWTKRGETIPEMSFYKNPDKFEIWWRHYIELWSKYPRTVYCIGHRGPSDRPFWLKDEFCPDTTEAHGKVITDTMEMQVRLLREICGEQGLYYCATLWQDGSPLHAAGALRFPAGTMVQMADHGGKQMMRSDFYKTPRQEGVEYGVYWHVCYGPGGPRWTEGASVDKMWFSIEQLVERGETSIVLLNVGSIRPYIPTLAAFSEMTTNADQFEPERSLLDWCEAEYGPAHAEEITECYNAFFNAYIEPYHAFYEGHRGFWDGVLSNESWRVFQLMYNGNPRDTYSGLARPFPSAWVFMTFHRNKVAASLGCWDAVCDWGHRISEKLAGPARDVFEGNLVVQGEMMRALSYATYYITRAGLAMIEENKEQAAEHLKSARSKIEAGWKYCVENGNRGVYRGWYTMNNITNFDFLRVIDDMLDKLAGREPKTQEDRDRIKKVFTLPKQVRWK